eukprot:scaffold474804_cov17-Prasinocladus_malaysianus.AAC.1
MSDVYVRTYNAPQYPYTYLYMYGPDYDMIILPRTVPYPHTDRMLRWQFHIVAVPCGGSIGEA